MELSLKHRNIKCSRYSPSSKPPCYFPGFTFKHFLNEINAVEVIIGICNNNCICALNGCYQSTELVRFFTLVAGAGGYGAYGGSTNYVVNKVDGSYPSPKSLGSFISEAGYCWVNI